jgi:hypothetical protein
MLEKTPQIQPIKDFVCVELQPYESDLGPIEFFIVLNKKSRVFGTSPIVTWPAFNDFLERTALGQRLKETIEKQPTPIGSIELIRTGRTNKEYFIISDFHPLGSTFGKYKTEWELFINIRGKRLGMLIETQMAKYLKRKYPGSMIRNSIILTSERTNQLAKHLGINLEAEWRTSYETTESYHKRLKKALREYAQRKKIPIELKMKKNSQTNRRARLRKMK